MFGGINHPFKSESDSDDRINQFSSITTSTCLIPIHFFPLSGTLDAISKMMRYEGVSGLYKGMGTKIVQSVFAAAVLFMVKEELVRAARVLVTGELRLIKSKSKSKPA